MINNSDYGGFIVSNNILEGKPIRYTFRDQSLHPFIERMESIIH